MAGSTAPDSEQASKMQRQENKLMYQWIQATKLCSIELTYLCLYFQQKVA